MKPTLLSFYMHDTGDKARLQLQGDNDFAHLELPASIHAPLRRLLADALVEMGRKLADAVVPLDARFADYPAGVIPAATDLGGPFNPNKRTAE